MVLFLPAVGVLLSQAAIADHIVNLELLDRAVFVDIPGDRAVIDVSVTLATDEDWEAAGLFGFTTHSSVSFVYARDPNTGAAFLTRPNRDGGGLTVDEEFVTFVSLPRGQSALARFGANGEPSIAAGYLGPSPVATVGIVDVGYFDPDLSTPEPAGYFQRIAIELAPGSFDPLDLYFSTSGPSDPGHIRVAHMISAAFLADADSHFHEEITWEIFAIPEPSMFALALLGAPFVVRRRARLWKRLTCVLMIGGSAAALGTAATTVVIGPQVRVDQGGVGQGDETSISATNVDPNVGRRRGQRLSRPTNRAGA